MNVNVSSKKKSVTDIIYYQKMLGQQREKKSPE